MWIKNQCKKNRNECTAYHERKSSERFFLVKTSYLSARLFIRKTKPSICIKWCWKYCSDKSKTIFFISNIYRWSDSQRISNLCYGFLINFTDKIVLLKWKEKTSDLFKWGNRFDVWGLKQWPNIERLKTIYELLKRRTSWMKPDIIYRSWEMLNWSSTSRMFFGIETKWRIVEKFVNSHI